MTLIVMEASRKVLGRTENNFFPPMFSIYTEPGNVSRGHCAFDRPFIVLTETKFSKRHIPVWARYSPLRTRVEAHANTLSP